MTFFALAEPSGSYIALFQNHTRVSATPQRDVVNNILTYFRLPVILKSAQNRAEISLPPALANIQNAEFSHPYYWAGFTMVGSPW
ncbi:MAG: hypothetical protein WBA93_02590 [Microcoleaceae cyanobacterium]